MKQGQPKGERNDFKRNDCKTSEISTGTWRRY